MRQIQKIIEAHEDRREQLVHYVVICTDDLLWEVTFDIRKGDFGEWKQIDFPNLPQKQSGGGHAC